LLIISPAIVLLVVLADKISERLGLNHLEGTVLRRWIAMSVLLLIWAPWTHYRASRVAKKRAED
jgi:hypothetical protein